ncbi:MAG: DUF3822 family protein, partial [Schleiferiaceae bacterium]|nr:DUF3822 family protein [Schleiferiaceae bacterium]
MGTGNHIQTVFETFDQSIEYTDSIDCHLSIYLSKNRLAFAIYAKMTNMFIGLGDYSSPQHNPHHLTEILEQFTGDFGSVSLAFDTHPSQIL